MQRIFNYFKAEKLYWVNILTTFISQGITALTIILVTPIIFKGLGTDAFGIYSVLLNLIILFSILDFGSNLGIIRKIVHHNSDSKKLIPTLLYFYLFISIFLVPVIYSYLTHSIQWNESNIYFAIIIAAIIFCNITSILFDSILQSLHFIYQTKIIRSFKTVLEFIGWVFILKLGNLSYLLGVTLFINVLYVIFLFFTVQRKFHFPISIQYFSLPILREHIRYSVWYFIAALAGVLIYNVQIIFFNQYTTPTIVAHFFIVTKFYEIIRIGASNFSQVLYPKIIQLEACKNWLGIKKMYFSSLLKALFLALSISIVLFLVGDFIFIKWAKLSDHDTMQLFHFYSIFIFLIIIDNVSVIYLAALKLNTWPTIVSFIQGILSAGFSYFLINQYGLIGAFYASITSFLMTNMLFNPFYLLQKIKIQSYTISNDL